ncbi:glycosyltransferase family 31 protein [Aureobasidium subglaciale EXF-2481]|uniref:N-acetylgalactosaminide beta-1,3-galactosyltransferase n=1 Tax=Aureobasidium subglaciale (strain EXF-2481) TaxID=1043005 RepID=A0A074YCH9_AURSE|nr:glycosyltransferase family 31 protein [Aureobasidium subglaciale EXF-2481]KEQ95498.1 glycosyltransferase family 31 protein [Aureobasidium subglaciale EXF-2481]
MPSDSMYKELPGANDTLVIMRTGATEMQDKLPIHLTTTLLRYPDSLIFSDYEEEIDSHHIIDALESVSPHLQETSPDFEHWRRLKGNGREVLKTDELSGKTVYLDGGTGKAKNPGWKLDKFKFLPMVNRTLYEYPDKKWYVFVETDTFIFWQTLLVYLSHLDWTKPYYLGGQINIGDVEFGQGGNGYVVSRPALEKVVSHYQAHQKEYEDFTEGHWAGDCVLGKALKDSGISLTRAWPIFQGDPVGNMNYRPGAQWCQPTVSYHHVSPSVIQDLYDFEKSWLAGAGNNVTSFLRHRDVYRLYALPRMATPRNDWDNHSNDDKGIAKSLESCRVICEADGNCVQYALNAESRCLTTSRPNVGRPAISMTSGWITERVQKFYDQAGECNDVE